MEVIGFGGAGRKMAKGFEKYAQYNVHYVDVGISGKNCYKLPRSKTIEQAEETVPKFLKLTRAIKKNKTFFICAGARITSGAILRTLEQIKEAKITLVYIRPDLSFLNEEEVKREKVTYRILQEFARSGLLEKMCIIDNACVAEILGDLSIVEYFSKINHALINTLHMINYLVESDSIIGNVCDTKEANRISTVSAYNLDKNQEKPYFLMENIREKHFYFALNQQTLENEKGMLKKIKEQVKKAGQSGQTSVSYDITATTYEENFAYVVSHTNFIQGEKNS